MQVKGKVALVLGAVKGIGKESALPLPTKVQNLS